MPTKFTVTVETRDAKIERYENVFNYVYDPFEGVHLQLDDLTKVEYPLDMVRKVISAEHRDD